jgi:SAM-dependent methyltransferase
MITAAVLLVERQEKSMTTRILEIGLEPNGGIAIDAKFEFADIVDKEIVSCDIDPDNNPDIIQDIREPFPAEHHGAFDIILCSHVLEHIEYNKIVFAMFHMLKCLKIGGQIMLVVPSLEWACKRVLDGYIDPAVYGILYGCQGDEHDYHKSGFTLEALHSIGDEFGLESREEISCEFGVRYKALMTDGSEVDEVIQCEQNVYIGRKLKEVETAKEEPNDKPETGKI